MRFISYLKDRLALIISYLGLICILILLFLAFKVPIALIVVVLMLVFLFLIGNILFDYFRKRKFYNDLIGNIERLDKSFLVCETLEKPNFYEGELLYHALYEINKSMCENIGDLKRQVRDFKDYIELWIHEVKLPIATSKMIIENNPNSITLSIDEELSEIENYIEQALYYARSEIANNDYYIKKCNLKDIVNEVIKKNKKNLITKKIKIETNNIEKIIYTDQKWTQFILNQIIQNSIKI